MNGPIRAVVFGVGATGSEATGILVERGFEIVGAIARSEAKVGKDLGVVSGLGQELGVPVRDDAEALLAEVQADIAVVATNSYLSEHEPHLAACAKTGTNAITASAEMLYPWRTSPAAAARLDQLAKAGGATLTGSGLQDVYWIGLVTTLLGAAREVRKISGFCGYDVDGVGPDAARELQIGVRAEDYRRAPEGDLPNASLNGLHCLAAALGLTVGETTSESHPRIAEQAVRCRSLGTDIEPGHVFGVARHDRVVTEEGIVLEMTDSGHVFGAGETERNEWTVEGTPNLNLVNETSTGISTAAQLVNRVPDVIAAEPGIVTVDRLPPLRYQVPGQKGTRRSRGVAGRSEGSRQYGRPGRSRPFAS